MIYSFKKHFAICMILSVILAVGSCTCDPGKPAGPDESAGDPPYKTITILLCTANVEGFVDVQFGKNGITDHKSDKFRNTADVLKPLFDLRQETTDDLVLIGLQEVPTTKKNEKKGIMYEINGIEEIKKSFPPSGGYEVYDHRGAGANWANTLVIYNKLQLKLDEKGIDLPDPNEELRKKNLPTVGRRYANILYFPAINLRVANTHILGGRFDDARWQLYPNIRTEQIKAILTHNPTIVMGDFNAGNQPILNSSNSKKKYLYGLHVELAQKGYIPLLTKQEIGPTSWGGGMIDWIYTTKKLTQEKGYTVVNWGVIKAIDQKLSDHNFPWIRIRIKDPR